MNHLLTKKGSSSELGQALLRDAIAGITALKKKHRSLFEADPKQFRQLIKKAEGRVLRLKPGPKPDHVIARAAREVARGARMEDVFRNCYPSLLKDAHEELYWMAFQNFRSKLNSHIRRSPYLKCMRQKRLERSKTAAVNSC